MRTLVLFVFIRSKLKGESKNLKIKRKQICTFYTIVAKVHKTALE